MSRISEIFAMMGIETFTSESIKTSLNELLSKYDIPVDACDVEIDYEGAIYVDFCDVDGDYLRLIFLVDEDGVFAIVDSDAENLIVFDLESMRPELRHISGVPHVDLTNKTWITRTLLKSLLSAGSYNESKSESFAMFGGKPRRIPVFSKVNKSKLSYKQKEAIAKSLTKRKYSISNSLKTNSKEKQDE